MILTLKTDSPVAEIGLYFADGREKAGYTWQADRRLANELLLKIKELLAQNGLDFTDLTGIVVFAGPGSFTGLRIGITVTNTIAYGQQIPIVAKTGDNWRKAGIETLVNGGDDKIALPLYGAEANITKPKK